MGLSIRSTFKRRFFAGLIISIPVIVTFLIIGWFFKFIDGFLEPIYFKILGRHVPGLGFISTIVLIFIVGIISTNVIGRKIIQLFEKVLLKIPILKSIYHSVKQLVDAFSPQGKSSFKKFVIVEYPKPGVYAFGFLTKECALDSKKLPDELNLKVVYIPTNLIYFGDIILFKNDNVFYTDIPIEEGIKIMLSGGLTAPHRIAEVKE